MALRDRAFHRHRGETTPRRWRFLVLWRYGQREVFASRWVIALFTLSFAPVLVSAVLFYLRYNATALATLALSASDLLAVDAGVFTVLLQIQAAFAFLLTTLVGPGLVAPDLANNGLALYLARPFSRTEYVIGKMSVLLVLTSAVTWVPLLALWLLQAGLEPGWALANVRIAVAVFLGSWIWIAFLALLALTLSAWVRWRMVAAALMAIVVLVGASLGAIVNEIFSTSWGDVLSPGLLMMSIWNGLFYGAGGPRAEIPVSELPLMAAWIALAVIAGVCLLVLDKKLAAYEVVR